MGLKNKLRGGTGEQIQTVFPEIEREGEELGQEMEGMLSPGWFLALSFEGEGLRAHSTER